MRYGRLVFSREFVSPTICNAGDVAQTFAIDEIYREMDIPSEEIVNIAIQDLSTYSGEKVLLPLNGYFRYSAEYPSFPTSEDIIPVFLGVYCTSRQYLRHKDYWKRFEPIGCRDEATMHAMHKAGIDAYLTGCMTILTPRRTEQTGHRILLVDALPKVEKYIPPDLLARAEHVTQIIPVDPQADRNETIAHCEEVSAELYRMYRDEAELVITSRLHVAAPCVAMGIPTIVVKDSFDERFGWLDKFIHLYSEDEFDRIDWNPQPVEMEEHRRMVMEMAVSMVYQAPDRVLIQAVHDTYMNRDRKRLKAPLMVRAYSWLAQYNPGLANFIRNKQLHRFTISAKSYRPN